MPGISCRSPAGPAGRSRESPAVAGLIALLRAFGPARLGAMGAVTAILVGLFAFIVLRLSQPQMATLYSGLSGEDIAAVTKQLESAGVHYELKGDGSTIMAPASDVPKLRIQLAGNGLPTGGSVGYEIFDKQA